MYTTNQIYSRIGFCSRSGIEPEIEMEQTTKPNVHGIDDQKAAAESYLESTGSGEREHRGYWGKHSRGRLESRREEADESEAPSQCDPVD
jgi:hypothetical protein